MKAKGPIAVRDANERLARMHTDLGFVFDVASAYGDEWAAATVTAVRRALGGDEPNNHLKVRAKRR